MCATAEKSFTDVRDIEHVSESAPGELVTNEAQSLVSYVGDRLHEHHSAQSLR